MVEDLLAGLDGLAPHPTGQDRLAGDLGVFCRAWAVAVGSLIACGVRIARSPSMLGSLDATSSAWA